MPKYARKRSYTGGSARPFKYARKAARTSAAAIRAGAFVLAPKASLAAKVDLNVQQTFLVGVNVATTWIEQDIVSPIVAGASIATRVGNQMWVAGVRIRGIVTGGQTYPVPVATDDPYNVFRMVLGLWQKTMGSTAFCSGTTLHQPIDPQFSSGIIKVFLDKALVINSPGQSGSGYQKACRSVDFYVPINRRISFTGNVAGSNTQQLVMSFLSDSSVNPSPQIEGTISVYYAP